MMLSYEQLPMLSFLFKLAGVFILLFAAWLLYRAKKTKKLKAKEVNKLVIIGLVTAAISFYVFYYVLGPTLIKPFIYSILE